MKIWTIVVAIVVAAGYVAASTVEPTIDNLSKMAGPAIFVAFTMLALAAILDSREERNL